MGKVKFMMPNDFGIYLHDTPHKEQFADDEPVDQQRLHPASRIARGSPPG